MVSPTGTHKPQPTPAQDQLAPQAGPRPAPASGVLVEELKQAGGAALRSLLEQMLRAADNVLLTLTEQATSESDRRRCLDLLGSLRMEQARLLRAMLHAADQSWNPLRPVSASGRVGAVEPEERVALTNLASRAKKLHRERIAELQRRLEQAVRDRALPLSPQAMSPARLCDALRLGLEPLELDLASRLLVYRLFDRTVITGLQPLYAELIAVLERHGLASSAPAGASAPVPAVDARTVQCLESVGAAGRKAVYADAMLALELLNAVRGEAGARGPVIAQRLALLGQMFNQILADPHLSPGLAAQLENLRFAAIKSALADSSFFLNPEHPARRMLHEAAQQAVSARAAGEPMLRNVAKRFDQLPAQLDVSASFVQPVLTQLEPLDGAQTAQFLDSQRAESNLRRDALLRRVRSIVAQELEVQILGLRLPPGTPALLRAGMGPLLAVRLLRYGGGGRLWHDAVDRLTQVLRTLDPSALNSDHQQMREELLTALSADLRDVGMAEDRIAHFISGLRSAYAIVDSEARRLLRKEEEAATLSTTEFRVLMDEFSEPAAATATAALPAPQPATAAPTPPLAEPAAEDTSATAEALLARILVPEQWFRVSDVEDSETRWLRLDSYYPRHDSVGMTGFDQDQSFKLSARRLMQDLISTRCEPINPTPDMTEALKELRRRAAA